MYGELWARTGDFFDVGRIMGSDGRFFPMLGELWARTGGFFRCGADFLLGRIFFTGVFPFLEAYVVQLHVIGVDLPFYNTWL